MTNLNLGDLGRQFIECFFSQLSGKTLSKLLYIKIGFLSICIKIKSLFGCFPQNNVVKMVSV